MTSSDKHQKVATATPLSPPQTAPDDKAKGPKRPKRIRPSRARGLRVNTGCVTCRTRRVKCDEEKPRCKQCEKANRSCQYAEPRSPRRREKPPKPSNDTGSIDVEPPEREQTIDIATPPELKIATSTGAKDREPVLNADVQPVGCPISPIPVADDFDTFPCFTPDPDPEPQSEQQLQQSQPLQDASSLDNMFVMGDADLGVVPDLSFSGSSHGDSPIICGTVSDWNFLAAQDSIDNAVGTAFSVDSSNELQPSIKPTLGDMPWSNYSPRAPMTDPIVDIPAPWNLNDRINTSREEATYIRYYTDVVGPMLDIMDLNRQFSNAVPHLAMYNIGLFKAMIALAARHMTEHGGDPRNVGTSTTVRRPSTPNEVAPQYYYEAIGYVSQNLCHQSYGKSPEIAATAILISAYEMLDENGSSETGNWERHLRGSFWIQRTQDNNAETECSLQRASWCAWVRQDIWAAFREGRRTLTLFHSRKPLEDLDEEQLTARIILIAARCVDFAAESSSACHADVHACMRRGEALLAELQRWHQLLPRSFHAVVSAPSVDDDQAPFPPVWIHPPAHAAAIQMFHFARIIVSLNQPCVGGREAYLKQQRRLDDSVRTICGIASSKQGEELPSACVNSQALFVAGLCVQSKEHRNAILMLLAKSHRVSKMSSDLTGHLQHVWQGDTNYRHV